MDVTNTGYIIQAMAHGNTKLSIQINILYAIEYIVAVRSLQGRAAPMGAKLAARRRRPGHGRHAGSVPLCSRFFEIHTGDDQLHSIGCNFMAACMSFGKIGPTGI